MISPINRTKLLPKAILSGIMLMSLSAAVSAGDLSVVGNSVTVSNTGSGSLGAKAIGANGLVADVTNVPTAATLDFPTFAFTFEKSAGFTDGTYTFRGGFIIDQDSSGRRLELSIPSISITVSGGTLTGSVSAAQSVNVLGRNDDSTIQAVTTISNNLATFSGSSLSFNADNQLSKIAAQGGILADITNSLNAAAHYHYAVFLKQTGGPENVRFGVNATTTLTPFPCNDGSAFVLNSGSLASSYSGAYALQGRVSFTGAAGVQEGLPAAYNSTCAEFSAGGGGGGGSTTTTDTSITNAETDLTSATTPDAIETAVDNANTLAGTIADQIASGTATIANGVTMLETLNTGLEVIGTSTSSGSTIDQTKVTATLTSFSSLVTAMGSSTTPLTSTQLNAVQSTVVTTMSNLINTIPATADPEQTEALLTQVGKLLQQISELPNSTLTASLADGARAISLSAAQKTEASIQSLFKTQLSLDDLKVGSGSAPSGGRLFFKSRVHKASKARIKTYALRGGIGISGSSTLNGSVIVSALQLDKVDSSAANSSAAITLPELGIDPTSVSVGTATGSILVSESLLNSIGVAGTTVAFNSSDFTLLISSGSLRVPTYVAEASIVSDIFGDGVDFAPDGSILTFANGISTILTPAPRDPTGFFTALENASITTAVSESGVMSLTATSGERLSGTFGFENVTLGPLNSTAVQFSAPSGDPASTDYVITTTYSDGSTQKFQPMLNSEAVLGSAAQQGVYLAVDRSTGIISSDDGIRLRADYFVSINSAADSTYLDANKDSLGVAYRLTSDFNNDGTLDVEVITASGKQILYVLP